MTAPGPLPAERARTVLQAASSASVRWDGGRADLVRASGCRLTGAAEVAAADDSAPARAVRAAPGQRLPTLVQVSDLSPLPSSDRVRARLTLAGWMAPVVTAAGRPEAGSRLGTVGALDLCGRGPGTVVARVDLVRVVLVDDAGAVAVPLTDYERARPDPLVRREADLLRHLLASSPDPMCALSRLLEPRLVQHCTLIRPVAVDRYGLGLRVEHPAGRTDVRLRFGRRADDLRSARAELDALVARGLRSPCRRRRERA